MVTGTQIGVCPNLPNNCSKAAAKELQTAPASKFDCAECGMSLRKPPDGKPFLPWQWIAAGVVGLGVLGGGGYFAYTSFRGDTRVSCPSGKLDEFLKRTPAADQLFKASQACLSAAKTASDAELVALAARLCRAAADGGKAEGALCLGQLYDPKALKPGRLGQMPAADFEVAFDNYRRASQLGSTEASAKLAELKAFVEMKAQEGNAEARQLLDRWTQ